ncbi:DUF943 family protein [Pantoea cypripedii]|uniref:DUF943 domain-containing protein n=1 Tax=Pantoea cypripedii TaxID=55209 RepID=A0A6B9FV57_PANCY|nr:DUF943 family protein [Pantoea cypripedii]QGY27481.1 hypothetical protein CUN67_00375 [Pantoea cypripedii]
MKRFFQLMIVLAFIACGAYVYLNNREVKVIDVHHGKYAADILVNHLPLSQSSRINWWLKNEAVIFSNYNISPGNEDGPQLITIFAFGDGYKELGKEDRLCFDDITPPNNCIDKDILMLVDRTRSGDLEFSFASSVYVRTNDGRITKVK